MNPTIVKPRSKWIVLDAWRVEIRGPRKTTNKDVHMLQCRTKVALWKLRDVVEALGFEFVSELS